MHRKLHLRIAACLLCMLILPFHAFSQQRKAGNETGLKLDLQEREPNYYQDALSEGFSLLVPPDAFFLQNNYLLGPGDILTVHLNAGKPYTYRALLVNASGDIILPGLGIYTVGGLTMTEASKTIQKKVSSTFSSSAVSLSLEKARPVVVYVNGPVNAPGRKVLPAFARVDLGVYSAVEDPNLSTGTPLSSINTAALLNRKNYDLRNIKIEQADGKLVQVDLVSFLLTGDQKYNPTLQHGDRIRISKLSPGSPRVSVSGSVQRPFEIQFKEGESLADLLRLAGGLTPEADKNKLYVFRSSENGIEKLEISPTNYDTFLLRGNDRIVVPEKLNEKNNASAWVYGEVQLPGNFPILNGTTTLDELLEMAGNLTADALPNAAYLIRAAKPNAGLSGTVNQELLKRTSDQLAQGFDYLELETRLSENRIFIDLTDPKQTKTLKIFDGDKLYIPEDQQTVFVFGQVNNPGYYTYLPSGNGHVNDYIRKAGGFALAADPARVFILKAGSGTWYSPSETSIQSGDRIFVDRIPYDELNAKRTYEIQRQQLKNQRTQLILTGLTTITGIITTYVAIKNVSN